MFPKRGNKGGDFIMDIAETTAPKSGSYNIISSEADFAEMETRMDERLARVRALHLNQNKNDMLASTVLSSGRLD